MTNQPRLTLASHSFGVVPLMAETVLGVMDEAMNPSRRFVFAADVAICGELA